MADATKDDHYTHSFNAETIIVITTLSISLYNAIELLLLIFVTFKKWGGLYFYSLLFATLGVLVYSLGYVTTFFQLIESYAGLIINNIGWSVMITGQAFVLYSRLHLVVSDTHILRAVLAMILVDAIVFHIPTTILNFCANYDDDPLIAAEGYKVYEKIQMTAFCMQEFVISGLYLWKTIELLKVSLKDDARRTMMQLLVINVIIIVLDLALLGIEYANLRVYEQVFKGVVYSVKLKLEYAILSKLVSVVKGSTRTMSDTFGEQGEATLDYVDKAKSTDDSTHAPKKEISGAGWKNRGEVQHVENSSGEERDGAERGTSSMPIPNGHMSERKRQDSYQPGSVDSRYGIGRPQPDEDAEVDLYADAIRQITRE